VKWTPSVVIGQVGVCSATKAQIDFSLVATARVEVKFVKVRFFDHNKAFAKSKNLDQPVKGAILGYRNIGIF